MQPLRSCSKPLSYIHNCLAQLVIGGMVYGGQSVPTFRIDMDSKYTASLGSQSFRPSWGNISAKRIISYRILSDFFHPLYRAFRRKSIQNAVICIFKNRGFPIRVNSDHRAGALHTCNVMYCAGNTDCDIYCWTNCFSG